MSALPAQNCFVWLIAAGLLSACVHNSRANKIIAEDEAKLASFLAGIRPCQAADLESGEPGVTGFLRRIGASCTTLECKRGCCNSCGGAWQLTPSGADPVVLFESAGTNAMIWSAMDCSLPFLDAKLNPKRAIARGALRERQNPYLVAGSQELVVRELCLIPDAPAARPSAQ